MILRDGSDAPCASVEDSSEKDGFMIRSASAILVLLAVGNGLAPIRADDFTIDLKVQAAKQTKSAGATFPAPDRQGQSRAIFAVDVRSSITVQWTVRNSDKAATVKDALVHFFVVKEEKPDQQDVPKLTKDVIVESALTMDFKAQDKTEGEIAFAVPNRGSYLLRLEIKGTAAKVQPFAALDLIVR
jgi:hypothetical protein